MTYFEFDGMRSDSRYLYTALLMIMMCFERRFGVYFKECDVYLNISFKARFFFHMRSSSPAYFTISALPAVLSSSNFNI